MSTKGSAAPKKDEPKRNPARIAKAKPLPETDVQPFADDDHAGQGGAYEVRDGKRVRVHGTKVEE